MKILFISHNFFPVIGGIEVNSEILAQAFTEAGHEVRLVTWTNDPEETSFPFNIYRSPNPFCLLDLHKWAELVFENNPCLRLSWPNLFFVKPNIVAVRTWISRSDGNYGLPDMLKRLWLKKARSVIAVSRAIQRKNFPKAIVIGNPYRVSQFRILPDVIRSKDFVFLGRLVSDKGVDQAIEAIYQLNGTNIRKFSLTVIGDGPEKKLLKDLVKTLDIKNFVQFKGALCGEELTRCLNEHKYILVPSRWEEPFGNVVLEGMACGCIPVVSNGGGLPDAVGDAGLIFQRSNIDDLVNKMQRLVENQELVERLKENATSHLAGHHPKIIANRYLEVVECAMLSTRKQTI